MIRTVLSVLILSWLCLEILPAQELTLSPYSRYALGESTPITTTRNEAMGGIGVATDNYFEINRLNPASYADISYTTFDVSGFAQFSRLRSNTGEEDQFSAGFQNVSLAFPSAKNFAIVMGFAPFSARGYNILTTTAITLDNQPFLEHIKYSADGGLNQFYMGFATKLFKKKLRLGVNFQYAFGQINNRWEIRTLKGSPSGSDSSFVYAQTPGYNGILIDRKAYLEGLNVSLGMIYVDTLNQANQLLLRVGATFDTKFSMKAERSEIVRSVEMTSTSLELPLDAFPSFIADTIRFEEQGKAVLPVKLGFGVMVHQLGKWSASVEATYQDWSEATYFGQQATTLGQELRISGGAEIIPDLRSYGFFKRTAYRFGGFYKTTYIRFGDQPVRDIGVTLGLGIPVSLKGERGPGRNTSRVNIAFILGSRGNLASGLPINELYARFRLGFNINDRWFIKRVVD